MTDEEYPQVVKDYIALDERRNDVVGKIATLDEDVEDLESRLKEVLAIGIEAQQLSIDLNYVKREVAWLDCELTKVSKKLRKTIDKYTSRDFEAELKALEAAAEVAGWEYTKVPVPELGENVFTNKWNKKTNNFDAPIGI